MSNQQRPPEQWGTKLGVILAVAGSAVGLGNFLRFPGLAANYGGSFMIPYFVALILLGIPVCWVEWTIGRRGGRFGFNSAPGIFQVLGKSPILKYLGSLGLLVPLVIYMYYIYIESWCLAYAWFFLAGRFESFGKNSAAYADFFSRTIGVQENGALFSNGIAPLFWFFLITCAVNFYIIYRGLSKGIETFCKIAMPLLIVTALVVAVRVLTLPEQPSPEPWQRALQSAIPSSRWEDLEEKLLDPTLSTVDMQALLKEEFDRYFEGVAQGTAGFDPNSSLAVPSGFGASVEGMAVALAELRSSEISTEYLDWLARTRESFSIEATKDLQRLEQRQRQIENEIAKKATELVDARKSGKLTDTLEADVAKNAKDAQSRLEKVERERAERLSSSLSTMPSFEKELDHLGYSDSRARRLQERSAALDIAELPKTVANGLGFMWNPDWETLADSNVWLLAAGQIFFSLSVGFGVIINYASYLKKKDDVVLSGLTASATNEFCEVCLGGLIAIPATFIFLGTTMTLEVINRQSSFGLGFNTMPNVFAEMAGGRWFGSAWFMLLFLAGITSSLSMLQPTIAFLEEGFKLTRRASVAALGTFSLIGSLLVVYFSKGTIVLDTLDYWVGTFLIYVLATVQVILFGWVLGAEKGFEEAHLGAQMRIPTVFKFIIKYVTPVYLLTIFGLWAFQNAPAQVAAIGESPVVLGSVIGIVFVLAVLLVLVRMASMRWQRDGRFEQGESE